MSRKIEYITLGIMSCILMVLICIQVKTINNNGGTVSINPREAELRDQVLKMKEKYETVYDKIQETTQQLEITRTRVSSNNNELKLLEEKIKNVSTLLGLTEVNGPGVIITVSDATSSIIGTDPSDLIVHNTDLLSIVNELKNAGAEAIEINGQRVIGTSAITCEGNVIMINGERVGSPFTINAIGSPELLANLNRPMGILENLQLYNIKTSLKKVDNIVIPKYTGILNFKYANNAS